MQGFVAYFVHSQSPVTGPYAWLQQIKLNLPLIYFQHIVDALEEEAYLQLSITKLYYSTIPAPQGRSIVSSMNTQSMHVWLNRCTQQWV